MDVPLPFLLLRAHWIQSALVSTPYKKTVKVNSPRHLKPINTTQHTQTDGSRRSFNNLTANTLQSRIMSVAACWRHLKPLQRPSLPVDGLSFWPSGVPSSSTSQSRKNSSLSPEWSLIFMSCALQICSFTAMNTTSMQDYSVFTHNTTVDYCN